GAKALGETVEELEARGIAVLLKGIQDHHQHLLTTTGVLRTGDHLFTSLDDAVAHARAHVQRASAQAR
ncbi:STAS domain-containing protein, partial [Amycolatopsis sp. NPDC021455]|uniref:STAS domain-containing protein n=1 Tax=Amycolatopsis sp. NPDC021455 TaxID=3154901 RepID=UPI0033C3D1EB